MLKQKLVFQESKIARGKFKLVESSNVFGIDKILNQNMSLREIEEFIDNKPTFIDVVLRSAK